jgi:Tol biopolymer transport system component
MWLMDAQRGTISRLTFSPTIQITGAWSADSSRLAIDSVGNDIKIFPVRNGGSAETITSDQIFRVDDWTKDGKTLLVGQQTSATGWDVLSMPADGGAAKPLMNSAFNEGTAHLSPDNRWMAYSSNESGRTEIYVVPYPGPGGRWQISNNGTATLGGAIWARNGNALFFQDAAGNLMETDVEGSSTEFRPSQPRKIFSSPGGVTPIGTTPDGRILVQVQADGQTSPPLTLVVNWDAELNR